MTSHTPQHSPGPPAHRDRAVRQAGRLRKALGGPSAAASTGGTTPATTSGS